MSTTVIAAVIGMTGSVAIAQQGSAQGPPPTVETRAVCGPVAGPFARCHAVQVLNPEALAHASSVRLQAQSVSFTSQAQPIPSPAKTKKGHGHPPTTTSTTVPTTTSTTSTTSTTTTSTTTTSTSTTSTTTTVPTTGCTNAHAGYTPCDLQSAYNPSSTPGDPGQTIAIVDAYDDPNAESDLAVYRQSYDLPACTTQNGCFRKVNQDGVAGHYPRANTGWAQEISLDLDMASAMCPQCTLLLVEARSNSLGNLLAAEQTAKNLGATVISNSWGAGEFSSETSYDHYVDQGIPITASSGDRGYGTSWPAASPSVVAVGGTSLTPSATTRGWAETAWSGAGSGCSLYEPKPSWQGDSGCTHRTIADVSAVADPSTGVAVYDTYRSSGWLVFGGTSVAAPIVASIYALAANATTNAAQLPYTHTSALNDVVSGSNGNCGGSYLCTAGSGYDGPTGFGTPNGLGGF